MNLNSQLTLLALTIMTGMYDQEDEPMTFAEIRASLVEGKFTGTEEHQELAMKLAIDVGYIEPSRSATQSGMGYALTQKGKDFVNRRETNHGRKKIICLSGITSLSNDLLLSTLETYKSEVGPTLRTLAEGLALAVTMADYVQNVDSDLFKVMENIDVEGLYGPLATTIFADSNMTPIPSGSSIGLVDRVNRRSIYVTVILPGYNHVIVQATSEVALVTELKLFAPEEVQSLYRRALRIEPSWRDDCNSDKVCFAGLFGFEYDKKDDEILVPSGRTETAVALSMKIHSAISGVVQGNLATDDVAKMAFSEAVEKEFPSLRH